MRKYVRQLACGGLLAAALSLGAAGFVFADESTFVQGTSVNGLGIGDMTVEDAKSHIASFYSSEYQLKIKERGGVSETIKGSDIGFGVGIPDGFLEEILAKENENGRAFGPDVDNKYRAEMTNTYQQDALEAKIQGLNCINGSDRVITADAHISGYQDGEAFTIIPEVRGNNVDLEKTARLIQEAVASGAAEVDLEASGCYYEPQVTADMQELKDLCDTMNRCREMTITYKIGEESEILPAETICSWITGSGDGQILLNQELVAAYVRELAAKYDTSGTARAFHTAGGQDVELTGPYGWRIDQSKEAEELTALVQTGESQEKEPAYALKAASRRAPDWGSTYAEVDLNGQHVYMIKDGQIVWDAPCVTGNVSKGHTTPAGIYSIAYKQRDRVLRGKKLEDGSYEYESPVSFWMPFNGGIGFHDANWRGSFGGSIYQTNGSHGCVNLPPSKAPALYELVYAGMPVICY